MKHLVKSLLFLFSLAASLVAGAAEQKPIYGIVQGEDLKSLQALLGKPQQIMPFEDGWIAYVYQFKDHNVVAETSPDDPQYIAAIQIEGDANPPGKGYAGINLGDNVDVALKMFGTPRERRPSLDEKTNQPVPNAFIYQYATVGFESTDGKITSIKVNFAPRKVETVLLKSAIQPEGLRNYAYRSWQDFVQNKYKCDKPSIVSIQPNPAVKGKVISEKWLADVCGQQRTFVPMLTPDAKGGYLVGFGE